jgi:hypothetical protein
MSCVSWWVNQGSPYALVVGTRTHRLLGADKELKKLARFAGSTVTITGEQFRSDVTVTAVQVERKRSIDVEKQLVPILVGQYDAFQIILTKNT